MSWTSASASASSAFRPRARARVRAICVTSRVCVRRLRKWSPGGLGGQAGEDLRLAGQAAKGAGVQDAGGVAREGSAIGMRRLGVHALAPGFPLLQRQSRVVRGAFQRVRGSCDAGALQLWLYRIGGYERPGLYGFGATNHQANAARAAIKLAVRLDWTTPQAGEYHPADSPRGVPRRHLADTLTWTRRKA